MGLITDSNNATFVSIYKGKLEVRVKPDTEGAIERKTTEGKTVHAKYYRALEGFITDIKKEVKELDGGKKMVNLKIHIDDVGEEYILSLPYDSGLTRAFYCMIFNVDLAFPVRFSASQKDDSTSFFMQQDAGNIKWKWTKDYKYAEGEERKPDWEKVTYKGEERWDNTKEIQFFERKMKEEILPKLRNGKVERNIPGAGNSNEPGFFPTVEPPVQEEKQVAHDDLPF